MQIKIYDAMVNGKLTRCVSGREVYAAVARPRKGNEGGALDHPHTWVALRCRWIGKTCVRRPVDNGKRVYIDWDLPIEFFPEFFAKKEPDLTVTWSDHEMSITTWTAPKPLPKPPAPATLSDLVADLRALLADFEELCPQQLPLIK